jgi:hypothetical protein
MLTPRTIAVSPDNKRDEPGIHIITFNDGSEVGVLKATLALPTLPQTGWDVREANVHFDQCYPARTPSSKHGDMDMFAPTASCDIVGVFVRNWFISGEDEDGFEEARLVTVALSVPRHVLLQEFHPIRPAEHIPYHVWSSCGDIHAIEMPRGIITAGITDGRHILCLYEYRDAATRMVIRVLNPNTTVISSPPNSGNNQNASPDLQLAPSQLVKGSSLSGFRRDKWLEHFQTQYRITSRDFKAGRFSPEPQRWVIDHRHIIYRVVSILFYPESFEFRRLHAQS